MPYKMRCRHIQDLLITEELDAFLVTDGANRYYLSGFTGSSGYLLITQEQVFLLTDFRYIAQANQEAKDCEVVNQGKNWYDTLDQLLSGNRVQRLAFEQDHVSHTQYLRLVEKLNKYVLTGKQNLVENLRIKKDQMELERMKKAASIADEAFSRLLAALKPGMKELEAAALLEYLMRNLGSEGPAFDTIVASGVRSAMPHGTAGDKVIERGDLIVFDFGAIYQGYRSDMTRTVVIGKASPKQKEIYRLVLEAQLAALEAIKAGVGCQQIDTVAREIIAGQGYGENFGHGLGHGVGLHVHENPRLAQGNPMVLEQGMVVTVEPGIYLDKWGGVRIEDMVVVTEQGCEIFTKTSKELVEL